MPKKVLHGVVVSDKENKTIKTADKKETKIELRKGLINTFIGS